MRIRIVKIALISWVFIVTVAGKVLAQCAMCRASVETNVNEDGIGFAAKLNTGILYLFVTPYILAVIIGYFWYKKSMEHRRRQEEADYRKSRISKLGSS